MIIDRFTHDTTRSSLGYAQVVAGAALFGFNGSVSKVVLDGGLPPARLAALRCTGTAIGLVLVVLATDRRRMRLARGDVPALAVLGLCGAALIQWLYFTAIDHLPVGIALLLEFTGPLLVALYTTVALRQALPRTVWLALGLSLSGLALVAQIWRGGRLDPIGVAAGLAAAASFATFHLVGKHTLQRRDPLSLTAWMFLFAALFWAVLQPWWRFDPGVLGRRVSLLGALDDVRVPLWFGLAWVVLLGTLVPYVLNLAALSNLTPTTTGVVGMIEPVIAAGVAWVWLGQSLGPVQLAGGATVLVAVGLIQLRPGVPAELSR